MISGSRRTTASVGSPQQGRKMAQKTTQAESSQLFTASYQSRKIKPVITQEIPGETGTPKPEMPGDLGKQHTNLLPVCTHPDLTQAETDPLILNLLSWLAFHSVMLKTLARRMESASRENHDFRRNFNPASWLKRTCALTEDPAVCRLCEHHCLC